MLDNNKVPNRLINETSPYLLQHAYNPVDWWPWCDEAFAKAKAEDKPVFLSIGYSTCHWCHVMENESFVDDEVASALREDFVSVKVDREERPDVDAVYMGVCQALTGSGGWPLTILMTPEQKPFFAGTYFPKRGRHGRPGLLELLTAAGRQWKNDRESLLSSGDRITEAISVDTGHAGARPISRETLQRAILELAGSHDARYGGFGTPPKFPAPHNLLFLMRCHSLGVGDNALAMAERTLNGICEGGIHDHVGGGFSRYSTDEKWLAPHFEKMLYDNALLVMSLLECYQLTDNQAYGKIAENTLLYVEREMTSPEGGFYSAQDADIGGEEGKYYTFTRDEVRRVLGQTDGERFCERYDITDRGNFESGNIPNLIGRGEYLVPEPDMERLLDKMYSYRKDRFELHKDDKILVSWNALMISALAKAYRVLGNARYLESAEKAFRFISERMMDENGGLRVSYRDGKSKGRGLLDDHAFLAWASLELYEATFDAAYLGRACDIMTDVIDRFTSASGGFFLSPEDGELLIFRPKEWYDGAMPSGNSAAAWCFVRLSALTGENKWREAVSSQLGFYGNMFHRAPTACTFAMCALMAEEYPSRELVCVVREAKWKRRIALELGRVYLPQTAIVVKAPEEAELLGRLAPFTRNYSLPEGKETAFYLCQDKSCSPPVYDIVEIKEILLAKTSG